MKNIWDVGVSNASLTPARFCDMHWYDCSRASAQTSLKLA